MKYPADNILLFQTYWQACSTGDETQIRAVVDVIITRFTPRIKALAWRYLAVDGPEHCEDLEQDLYVSALEILPSIPHDHPAPSGYLARILKLRWCGFIRQALDRRDHQVSLEQPLTADNFTLADVLVAPDTVFLDERASAKLQAALSWLPPLQRIAIQTRYQFENVTCPALPPGLSSRWKRDAQLSAYHALRRLLSTSDVVATRVCSECGAPIVGKNTHRVLCEKQQCRTHRNKRIQQEKKVQVLM